MYCQKCGIENPEEAKFCKNCGFQFQKEEMIKCSTCGAENSKTTKFCQRCGSILTDSYNFEKRVSQYRFYLQNQIGFGKRTFFELFLDTKLIHSDLLKNGFNITKEVERGDNVHLVEIKIVQKNFHFDDWVKDFNQKINFELISGNILEFKLKNPFIGECYFELKP